MVFVEEKALLAVPFSAEWAVSGLRGTGDGARVKT